jgi:DNA (cytosine-5)-methyltransferase 1
MASGGKLKVLSLFAGIGGFDLGLERTGGFETVAFCEIEPFCQRVLKQHWPEVPCYDDVRQLKGDDVSPIDVICGGFPCQDISSSGPKVGIEGKRSGLWSEYARVIGELRPSFVIVENVADLVARGLGTVLGDLAALGYDAWWDCIRASDVGAPHQRARIWIIAYAGSEQHEGRSASFSRSIAAELACAAAHAKGFRLEEQRLPAEGREVVAESAGGRGRGDYAGWERQWAAEPNVGRVAHGVPARVDRLKALGNAVVPQIPELIGRAILASLEQAKAA